MKDDEHPRKDEIGQGPRTSPRPAEPPRKVFVRVPPDATDEEIDAIADLMIDKLLGWDALSQF